MTIIGCLLDELSRFITCDKTILLPNTSLKLPVGGGQPWGKRTSRFWAVDSQTACYSGCLPWIRVLTFFLILIACLAISLESKPTCGQPAVPG